MFYLQPRISLNYGPKVYRMVSAVNVKNGEWHDKYSEEQKHKILEIINDSDASTLSRYNITKSRTKNLKQWVLQNGYLRTIADVELVEGFSQKLAKKFFDSIFDETPKDVQSLTKKIKGQILQPHLSESMIQSCRSVLAVNITVNSVCWTHIDKSNYEVLEWMYYSIEQKKDKKMQLTDIFEIALEVCKNLPSADIYVMKAEATTLRAAGSDPNNPKVMSVNLQKAQMIAMIVALLNTRKTSNVEVSEEPTQKVFFLRPTLPFRLYGTLIGNERVSTDQTVECLLQEIQERSPNNTKVYVSERLKTMFRNQKDLQKDMLGQCLLLALTFMDLCVYKNVDSINKLLKRAE